MSAHSLRSPATCDNRKVSRFLEQNKAQDCSTAANGRFSESCFAAAPTTPMLSHLWRIASQPTRSWDTSSASTHMPTIAILKTLWAATEHQLEATSPPDLLFGPLHMHSSGKPSGIANNQGHWHTLGNNLCDEPCHCSFCFTHLIHRGVASRGAHAWWPPRGCQHSTTASLAGCRTSGISPKHACYLTRLRQAHALGPHQVF